MEKNASRPLDGMKKWVWLLGFAYFFYLMLAITMKYIPAGSETAFLVLKQEEVNGVPLYLIVFYIHVYSSIFVLLAGFTQFNRRLVQRRPAVHRAAGRLYAYVVVLFSAPSGIYIGLHANGGLLSRISFVALGVLWLYFTLRGVMAIRCRNITRHHHMMLRSFALAASAITLRLWKVILVYSFEPNPMDAYRIIAWLGWIPNLLLVEWYIRNTTRK